jgi:two-component system chemotaxis response regulator CheB
MALRTLLADMGANWPTPILVVQHMPATFTRILAEHLARGCGFPVREAARDEALEPGVVYIAPGEFHMTVRPGARPTVALDQDPPENWCRPAVDKLFRSAAAVYGGRTLAIILTGMGHDGREGARALVAKGGAVLAQDEPSSVVWGMPGAVVEAGLAAHVAPLSGLGAAARRFVRGGPV